MVSNYDIQPFLNEIVAIEYIHRIRHEVPNEKTLIVLQYYLGKIRDLSTKKNFDIESEIDVCDFVTALRDILLLCFETNEFALSVIRVCKEIMLLLQKMTRKQQRIATSTPISSKTGAISKTTKK